MRIHSSPLNFQGVFTQLVIASSQQACHTGSRKKLYQVLSELHSAVDGRPPEFPCTVQSIIRIFFFSDYLEVTTAVVVLRGVGKNSPYIDIALIFFIFWSFRNNGF